MGGKSWPRRGTRLSAGAVRQPPRPRGRRKLQTLAAKGRGCLYRTTTDLPANAWAEPDFRLWLALHLPADARVADAVNEAMDRTRVIVYTAAGRAEVDYTRGEPGPWPVTQDEVRLWNTVEAAWRSWRRYDQPERIRIGTTAQADGEQWAWLDQPDGPIRWPLPAQ